MKITEENYIELKNKLENLEKVINGGKGSGNFGHGGRPGKVGGSSRSATTTARMARGDAIAEARQKADELEKALHESEYSELTDREYAKRSDEVRKAFEKTRKLEAENEKLSKEEIERGQAKKREQDTPGKKETAKALEEAKKASETTRKAWDKEREAEYGSEERDKAREEANKAHEISKEATKKLEKAVASQMSQDKQFADDLKQHIEDGLGIKLKDFKLNAETAHSYGEEQTTVSGTAKLNNKDLGAFGKVFRKANVNLSTSMVKDSTQDDFGTMWGHVYLDYESRGGGGNGQNVLSVWYNPDGTYTIMDRRGL